MLRARSAAEARYCVRGVEMLCEFVVSLFVAPDLALAVLVNKTLQGCERLQPRGSLIAALQYQAATTRRISLRPKITSQIMVETPETSNSGRLPLFSGTATYVDFENRRLCPFQRVAMDDASLSLS